MSWVPKIVSEGMKYFKANTEDWVKSPCHLAYRQAGAVRDNRTGMPPKFLLNGGSKFLGGILVNFYVMCHDGFVTLEP